MPKHSAFSPTLPKVFRAAPSGPDCHEWAAVGLHVLHTLGQPADSEQADGGNYSWAMETVVEQIPGSPTEPHWGPLQNAGEHLGERRARRAKATPLSWIGQQAKRECATRCRGEQQEAKGEKIQKPPAGVGRRLSS